jgi:hypothetical protein
VFGKIKIRPSDSVFSIYIRTRDNWTCQKCGASFSPPTRQLQNSHFWGRGKESTRFDPENCDALCVKCHQWFEEHKTEYEAWKKDRMGEQAFNKLMVRAHTPGKRDDTLALIVAKALLDGISREKAG